ncbi:hypothetical protein NQ318_008161 [Aromia moschata]|uniref:Uncharacterized protein n=1 Tax=Aromia moschata TaxID=1265417 RepID=A0AAV8YL34_9CUCU|nr:hypothetical protein NQ318_008161 [Aromia moschata]
MLEWSQVNCCPGSMLSYSCENFRLSFALSLSMWLASSEIGIGGCDTIAGVWKFSLLRGGNQSAWTQEGRLVNYMHVYSILPVLRTALTLPDKTPGPAYAQ